MKLQGMAGKGTGKLGSMVYASVRGTQIVRQYNPIVYNPNTEKQSLQRARFSLLTKMAAMVSPALVFQGREGMVTNRNAFIKANFGKFEEDEALLNFNDLTLTSGNIQAVRYPTVSVNSSTHVMTINMVSAETTFAGFGVAIILAPENADGKPWVYSAIQSAGNDRTATLTVTLPTGGSYGEAYVIGYPMFYKDGATRTSYANTVVGMDTESDVAISLLYNRMAGKGDLIVYATKPLAKTV